MVASGGYDVPRDLTRDRQRALDLEEQISAPAPRVIKPAPRRKPQPGILRRLWQRLTRSTNPKGTP